MKQKEFIRHIKDFLPNWIGLVMLFIAYIFVAAPFFHHGFFPTTDDVSVVRIDVFSQELKTLQFPVRYAQEFGNNGGYFLFGYFSNLVYFLGFIFHFIGLSLVKSTKMVFLTSYLVGISGMYVLLRRFTSKTVSVIGSIIFITTPYLNFDVYFRGALPEFFAMCLIPWVLWGFFRLKEKATIFNFLLAGVLYALIINAHSLTAFMLSWMLALFLLFPPYSKKIFLAFFASLLLGLGLSSYMLFTTLGEISYTMYDRTWFVTTAYLGNFINPLQLFGLEKINWTIKHPFLGIGFFIGVGISLVVLYVQRKYKKGLNMVAAFSIFGSIICILLLWNFSKPLWDNVTLVRDIQFPYRIITVIAVLVILMISIGLEKVKKVWLQIVFGIIIILPSLTLHYAYLRPATYNYISIYKAEDTCSTSTWATEYLPKWVKVCLPKHNTYPVISSIENAVKIQNVKVVNNGRKITFNSIGKGEIVVLRYYFPSWQALIDGKNVQIKPYGKYGLLSFKTTSGKHDITIILGQTLVEKAGDIITLISIGICILTLVILVRSKKKRKV